MPNFPSGGEGNVDSVTAGNNVSVSGTTQFPIVSAIRDTVIANYYCSSTGSDSNDGLGWQTAKGTILGAIDAAIQVAASNIHIAKNTPIGPNADDGIWLAGTTDSGCHTFSNCVFTHSSAVVTRAAGGFNAVITVGDTIYHGVSFKRYVVLTKDSDTQITLTAAVTEVTATTDAIRFPPGWRLGSSALSFHGWAGTPGGLSPQPMTRILGGAQSGTDKPAIWLSSTSAGFLFENIQVQNAAIPLRMGVDSDGTRGAQVALVRFDNCELSAKAALTGADVVGPTVDIGCAEWIYFRNVTFGGVGSQITRTANNRALVLINPSALGAGLIYLEDCRGTGGGGVKQITNGFSFGCDISHFSTEGDGSGAAPSYWCPDANNFGRVRLHDLAVNDDVTPNGNILIEGGINPGVVIVSESEDVRGGCTVLNAPPAVIATETVNPASYGQNGFWQNRVIARQDSARRAFGATEARFQNLANYNVAGLTPSANITLASATSPDGLSNAGRISTATSGTHAQTLYSASFTPASNEWVMFGAWVRRHTRLAPAPSPLVFALPSGTSFVGGQTTCTLVMPSLGDGEWEWLFDGKKIGTAGSADTATMIANVDPDNTLDVAYPVLIHIAASTISDNEAADLIMHWKAAPDFMTPGMAGTMPGQIFAADGGLVIGKSGYASGTVAMFDGASAAVSASGTGALRYNAGTNKIQYSKNGGAWSDLV